MTLKVNKVCAVVKIHVHAKYRQAECNGSSLLSCTQAFLPYLAMVKKSDNPVLWPLTYDLEIFCVPCGCQEHVHAIFHRAKWCG